MTIAEWQQLSPAAAAREVHARVAALPSAQRRAIIASLRDEDALGDELASAAMHAKRGLLSATPYLAKDLFGIRGVPTLAGSTFLGEIQPPPATDAALVTAARMHGLVWAGKTHLHEFAYGITGENPHYGDCEHPQHPGRTSGGSSSGSAAAVAARVVPVAFGTDTGGSIRVPAAFCGLFGYRGAVAEPWIRDAFPLAPSFDTAGWFTRNLADMRRMLREFTTLPTADRPPRGCFLELPGLDAEVAKAYQAAAAALTDRADNATADELRQAFAVAPECYGTIVAVEAWQVHAGWAEKYRDRYDPAVWQRLNRGHDISAAGVATARAAAAALQTTWAKFFLTYDFLVLPATPCPALTKAECTLENRNRILALTTPASVAGVPVLTLPLALPSGLTTGVQVIVNQSRSPALAHALAVAQEKPFRVSP